MRSGTNKASGKKVEKESEEVRGVEMSRGEEEGWKSGEPSDRKV